MISASCSISSINFSFNLPLGNCDICLISCDIFKSVLFIPSFFSGLSNSIFSFKEEGEDDDSIINNFFFLVLLFLPTFLLFFLSDEEVFKSGEPLDDDSIISLLFFCVIFLPFGIIYNIFYKNII